MRGKTPKEYRADAKNLHLLIDLIKEKENDGDKKGEYNPKQTYSTYLGIDITHLLRKEFETLVPKLPYIGGRKNRNTDNLVNSTLVLAVIRILEKK